MWRKKCSQRISRKKKRIYRLEDIEEEKFVEAKETAKEKVMVTGKESHIEAFKKSSVYENIGDPSFITPKIVSLFRLSLDPN